MIARSCRPKVKIANGENYLFVDVDSTCQIFGTSLLGFNQMVTMHGRGNGDLGKSSTHKLKDDHLGSGILTSDPVWSQVEIRLAADNFLLFWVVQVTIQYFLRVG